MKVLMVSAEAAPFAKTGGLAEVTTSLSKALASLGHEIAIVIPKYLTVDRNGFKTEPIDLPLLLRIKETERTGWFHKTSLEKTSVSVFMVANDHYFNRNGLYQENGKDYPDNLERFVFFNRAVLELLKAEAFTPDIIHCHDWQAALIPTYLKTGFESDLETRGLRTVFTAHNLAYQGFFPREQFPVTGLDWDLFTPEGIEYYGDINLLKAGLIYSDQVSTVSEKYAAEIMTSEYGCGLESVVISIGQQLVGITNGVDYEVWDPKTDPNLAARYSPEDFSGKAICKSELQKELGLPQNRDVPLLANIGRFDHQKGLDLLAEALEELLLAEELQCVVLGTGRQEIERLFHDLQSRYPNQVRVRVGYEEELAHRILAGADVFVMPSRYEPCGLVQLQSLKYGAPPVVRRTGGLQDTVRDFNDAQTDGYGFVFENSDTKELIHALLSALAVYRDKTVWSAVMRRGMACDFSWNVSAAKYEDLYSRMLEGGD